MHCVLGNKCMNTYTDEFKSRKTLLRTSCIYCTLQTSLKSPIAFYFNAVNIDPQSARFLLCPVQTWLFRQGDVTCKTFRVQKLQELFCISLCFMNSNQEK